MNNDFYTHSYIVIVLQWSKFHTKQCNLKRYIFINSFLSILFRQNKRLCGIEKFHIIITLYFSYSYKCPVNFEKKNGQNYRYMKNHLNDFAIFLYTSNFYTCIISFMNFVIVQKYQEKSIIDNWKNKINYKIVSMYLI